MALFYPTIDVIKKFKVQPTAGEWALLCFLSSVLDDSFEVFFNPFLNGDRPDIIIMRKDYGVMVIEVKDWNLNNYHLDDNRKWVLTQNDSVIKSPIDQVLKYKDNLYNLHVEDLLLHKIVDYRYFSIVACAVYFHNASKKEINDMLISPYLNDEKYQKFLDYNIDFIGKDSLTPESFKSLLRKRYLIANHKSYLFSDKLYNNFRRLLAPSVYLVEQGIPYTYSDKQKSIIYSDRLEQRVRGDYGTGKTTVLAARAVQAYKRALKRNNNPRILILTFNITLKNFIHDKLNRVEERIPPENVVVINYHQFINAELNNLNVDIVVPKGLDDNEINDYLEKNYYGNKALFKKHENQITKYDSVLIDEIQDYHRAWMEIIKECFRNPEGDYVLFGDVKQNIYNQPTLNKDVNTNVKGVVILNDSCFRSDFKVQKLVLSYQEKIFEDKYFVDDFSEGRMDLFMGQEGSINYHYIVAPTEEDRIISLYNIIRECILNKVNNISPNDITILGFRTDLLRQFDSLYRYACRERTNSMLETIETMYLMHINYISKSNKSTHYQWFKEIINQLEGSILPRKTRSKVEKEIRIKNILAKLFTAYDLYVRFGSSYKVSLEEECKKNGISVEEFISFYNKHKDLLSDFRTSVYSDNYKIIRDNKKLHFWMNSGTIKVSTINSFKGWESEVIFLILEPRYSISTEFNVSFDELLYTGITRCRRHLFIINYGNDEYDAKLLPIINSIE